MNGCIRKKEVFINPMSGIWSHEDYFINGAELCNPLRFFKKNFIALCFECFFSYGKTVSSSMTFGSPTIPHLKPICISR